MANILFASNSVTHFPGTIESNLAWSYDSGRVPHSILTAPGIPAISPDLNITGTETWFHFRCGSEDWYLNNREQLWEILEANGTRIARLRVYPRTTSGWLLEIQNGAQVTEGEYLQSPILEEQLRTFDIKVEITALILRVTLYINEAQYLQEELSITTPQPPVIANFTIGGSSGNNTVGSNFSEIMVADGDTRNARLDLLRPQAAGHYSQWDGLLSTIADEDPTSGLKTKVDNEKHSSTLTPYVNADNISNIVTVTTALRGLNAPPKLNHFFRMSGVDYPSTTDFDIGDNKEYQVTDWQTNPGTSQAWESADLATIEFGFESKPAS